MEFQEAKDILLKDIRGIKEKDSRLFVGMDSYTMPELANEIEKETEFGKKQVHMFISAMETIERIKQERNLIKKPWWKFW